MGELIVSMAIFKSYVKLHGVDCSDLTRMLFRIGGISILIEQYFRIAMSKSSSTIFLFICIYMHIYIHTYIYIEIMTVYAHMYTVHRERED